MAYIDGFVIPVPKGKKDAYLAMARMAAPLFREHGALRVVECWGDDVPHGKVTDFYRAVAATEEETTVFSWIVWPSREARDEGNRKIMADPRMVVPEDSPTDFKRLVFGGFEVMLDTGSDGESAA